MAILCFVGVVCHFARELARGKWLKELRPWSHAMGSFGRAQAELSTPNAPLTLMLTHEQRVHKCDIEEKNNFFYDDTNVVDLFSSPSSTYQEKQSCSRTAAKIFSVHPSRINNTQACDNKSLTDLQIGEFFRTREKYFSDVFRTSRFSFAKTTSWFFSYEEKNFFLPWHRKNFLIDNLLAKTSKVFCRSCTWCVCRSCRILSEKKIFFFL